MPASTETNGCVAGGSCSARGGLVEADARRLQTIVNSGVQVIVLLALSDYGRPSDDAKNGAAIAAMGCPVFACTPDHFPDLMATALKRDDIWAWAASRDIALVRAGHAGALSLSR